VYKISVQLAVYIYQRRESNVKIFCLMRDQQVVAFFKDEALAREVAGILSANASGGFHTLWNEMEGEPRIETNKGVVIYACIEDWAGELLVESVHSDFASAEEALNINATATRKCVFPFPLIG
jgi:hypothetical protein